MLTGIRRKLASLGWQAAVIPGILGVFFYCVFTFISFLFFPAPFSPFEHVLSELGVSSSNPNGAVFYGVGVILLGGSLVPFFIGLYHWLSDGERKRRSDVVLVAGVFTGVSLVMTGVFPGEFLVLHFIWAMLFFIFFALTIVMMNTALFSRPRIDRRISVYGYLVVAFDLIFLIQILLGGLVITAITEWITVFAFLGWVGLIACVVLHESFRVKGNHP
jgi:hypothetical protein